MKHNRRDVPSNAKDLTGRVKKSAKYYKSNEQIFVSYWDKGRRPVILLSTIHTTAKNTEHGLPEIVEDYNTTKSGFDLMDRQVNYYSCRRISFRWTFCFFFNLVDVALLNASMHHAILVVRCFDTVCSFQFFDELWLPTR